MTYWVVERGSQLTLGSLSRLLVKTLHEHPDMDDCLVEMEGCDCYGECGGYEYHPDSRRFILSYPQPEKA